jgi:hypothetical protein
MSKYYTPTTKPMQLATRWWLVLMMVVAMWVTACGDAVPAAPVTAADTATVPHLIMRGDSITHQTGQTIAKFLPGWVVDNLGVDASILADVVQPVMTFDKDKVYSYSYGPNECMGQRVSVADFTATLNHVAAQGVGYKLIFEAPWRLTHSACSPYIDDYRQAVVDIGRLYGIPVVIESDQSDSPDQIHLTGKHQRDRVRLLAAEVLKL